MGGWGWGVQPIWSSAFWVVDCRWREGGKRMRALYLKHPFRHRIFLFFLCIFLGLLNPEWSHGEMFRQPHSTSWQGREHDQVSYIKVWSACICKNVQINVCGAACITCANLWVIRVWCEAAGIAHLCGEDPWNLPKLFLSSPETAHTWTKDSMQTQMNTGRRVAW